MGTPEGPQPVARVLVVDDEPDVLASLGDLLRELGPLEVDQASSLATALVLLRERRYDVVISDERLSDGSGVELLRWAGHLDPSMGRVLVSGFEDFHALQEAVNLARIHLFVLKPWDPERLGRDLHRLLLEQAALHERIRALARASAAGDAPAEAPVSSGPWPPS